MTGEPLAVDVMNTVWLQHDGAHDALATVAGLGEWLIERGLSRRIPTERMRVALVETRAVLRDVVEDEPGAEHRLNQVLARGAISRELRDGQVRQIVTVDPAWAVAWEAADDYLRLRESAADGIRCCEQPACVLYFYDPSGRRRWCSMAGCGNRAKAQRHYAKQRA
ncbi:MAG: CGNR zinc finger domain-containing protein [Microbacteriaceae bacterium]